MTDEAASTPHDLLASIREGFIRDSETFMVNVIEGLGSIDQAFRNAETAHSSEIQEIRRAHGAEVTRLQLAATTAKAAAEESVRHRTALAVAEVENSFTARLEQELAEAARKSEEEHARAVAELKDQHAADRSAQDTRHGDELQGLAREAAKQTDEVRNEVAQALEAAKAEARADERSKFSEDLDRERAAHQGELSSVKTAHATELGELRARHDEALAAQRTEHEKALETLRSANAEASAKQQTQHEETLAAVRSSHAIELAGAQAIFLAADGARLAAEGRAAEAEGQAQAMREAAEQAPIASEIEDILYPPQGENAEELRQQLDEAQRELEGLRAGSREAADGAAQLQGKLDAAQEEIRVLRETPAPTCEHEPADATSLSMRIARTETQKIVRLVADGNPHIMLTEAADLLSAALTGRTEMPLSLPMPVLLDAAS